MHDFSFLDFIFYVVLAFGAGCAGAFIYMVVRRIRS
jgi:H+/Cl- antiporter ClcA